MRNILGFGLAAVVTWVATLPAVLCAQTPDDKIIELLKTNDIVVARERARQAFRNHPNSALAAYTHAVLEEEAVVAAALFEDIISRHPNSIYAQRSLYRLAQYNFSRGSYVRAREYFLKLVQDYPSSPQVPQAAYYAAKSLMIYEGLPAARDELAEVIRNYSGTWAADFAQEDLGNELIRPRPRSAVSAARKEVSYAVQVGAFLHKENAESRKRVFSDTDYKVEVREIRDGAKRYYVVWLGEFADRFAARKFGDEIQRQYKIRGHVVRRNER